jgi:uncharacterized phage-associated protein
MPKGVDMTIKYRFNKPKAIEVLLYITSKQRDMYHALKILYFADKQHLEKYGRLICGDSYVAMEHGPVPSGTYDIIKSARGQGISPSDTDIEQIIKLDNNNIIPQREARTQMLSESDIECLDNAIRQYGDMSFEQLKNISHNEPSYKAAGENDFIPIEELIKQLDDSDDLLEYLQLT